MFIQGNSCLTIFEAYNKKGHPNCNLYFSGAFNTNWLTSLKGIRSVLTSQMKNWEDIRHSMPLTLEFIKQREISFLFNMLQPILTDYYYSLTSAQTVTLIEILESDSQYIQLISYLMIFIQFLCGCCMITKVFVCTGESIAKCTMIIELISYNLLEQNPIFRNHIKKVSKGGHRYKI